MIPLAPASPKRIRKAIKKFRRLAEGPCARGELLRLLVSEGDPEVPLLRPTAEDTARLAFIDAGRRYCLARCGGCALTEGWTPSN